MSKQVIGVDIFQPLIPEYRLGLFRELLSDDRFDVGIQASQDFLGTRSEPNLPEQYDLHHPALKIGSFVWQKALCLQCARRRGDVIVVCGDPHQLSNLPLMLLAKFRGIGVVCWGHHQTAFAKGWRVWVRLWVMRMLSDVYLCYTKEGITYLEAHGFEKGRVFATGNTIDQAPILKAIKYWTADRLEAFRLEHRLVGKDILLFCSMLRRKTRLDVLIRALASETLKKNVLELVVIGDGEMRSEYQALAAELGVLDRVRWLGVMREQHEMAPWFLNSKTFVYPGAIGLSLLHSFSYGLPVITHSNKVNQMPEFEAMVSGETGLTFEEGSIASLAEAIKSMLSSESKRLHMSARSKRIAYENYTISLMGKNFKRALIECSELVLK